MDFKNNTIYNYTLIDVKGENCTISNCDFINNFANENGILYFENILSCNLLDCSFESNNASKLGGAIYSKNSNLNIEKCIITNYNSVGIFFGAFNVYMKDTDISNNDIEQYMFNLSSLGKISFVGDVNIKKNNQKA